MIAAPVQGDVDGIPKGSHYVLLKRANVQHELRREAPSASCFMLLLGDPCTTLASRHVASETPAVTWSASGVAAASQQPLE
jgi:hypothetical protein